MSEEAATQDPAGRATRRAVLLGAGAAGVAGVLAACGAEGPTQPQIPPATMPATTPPVTPTAPRTPAPTGPDGIPVSQVPVGGGVIDTERRVVVTQPVAGEFRAFDAVCQHEFCLVSQIGDGLITCTCHGSQYRVDDGSVARGPATRGLPARTATVTDGVVVVG